MAMGRCEFLAVEGAEQDSVLPLVHEDEEGCQPTDHMVDHYVAFFHGMSVEPVILAYE